MKWILILLLGCFLAETTLGWTYHRSERTMNWTQARQWCQTKYTDMVVIQSQIENDHLVSWLPPKNQGPYYWIGITKNHINETWTWIGNNSTWVGEQSWAKNEPNNDHITEFCVEIYANKGHNRGKWNDEKCANTKYAVCYEAQCNATSCDRGRCQETINNITCLYEPGFEGDQCQKGQAEDHIQNADQNTCISMYTVECPPLSPPDNGYHSCPGGNLTSNTTCRFKCNLGFLITGSLDVTCGVTGVWSGPRPYCASYKEALLAVAGCGAASALGCICLCWMKRRKRKKLAQGRHLEESTSPSTEEQG